MSGSSSPSVDGAQKRNIFDRHDRRQAIGPPGPAVPTKAALARANRERDKPLDVPFWLASTAHAPAPPGPGAPKAAIVRTGTSSPRSEGMPASLQLRSPWTAGVRLGDLVQGGERMTLCVAEAGDKEVVMFKRLAKREGVDEMRVLQQIRHPNIVPLKQAFLDGESIYLGLEYHRCTLGELLCVHIDLDEPAIQYIARSVKLAEFPTWLEAYALSGLRSSQVHHGGRLLSSADRSPVDQGISQERAGGLEYVFFTPSGGTVGVAR